jgi:ABC-2 type transport system permease protein
MQLLRNEFFRTSIIFRRYLGESLIGLMVLTLIFYGIFLGSSYLAGPAAQFGNRLESLVVGFVAWTLVLSAFTSLASNISEEAQTGVLEQVFMSSHSPLTVFWARAIAAVLFALALNLSVLGMLILLTGARIHLPWAIVPVLIAVLLSSYGLGFMLGAVALVWKRITQLSSLLQFVLLFCVMTPFEQLHPPLPQLARLLPGVPGVELMRGIMARAEPLELNGLVLALVNGVVYFVLGIALFNQAVRFIRQRGLTGGY